MNILNRLGVSGLLATGAMLYSVGANAAPAPMANGEVSFTNVAASATLQFSVKEAFQNRDAKGSVTYTETDTDGTVHYYTVDVTCVDVTDGQATFSGQIVDTNVDAWKDLGVQIWVKDSGQKSGTGDQIGGQFFTWTADDPSTTVDESEANCLPYDAAPGWITVDSGNVVIHNGQVGQGHSNGGKGGGDNDENENDD